MKKSILEICVRIDIAYFLKVLNYWPAKQFYLGHFPLLAIVYVQIFLEAFRNVEIIDPISPNNRYFRN
jgi:hypothetical protein